MFATTLFLVVLAGPTHWGLPHAGKALNQSELTYFRDMAIIEVSQPKMLAEPRKASTVTGTNAIEVVAQSARVLDANFESVTDVRLVFTPHLPYPMADTPGWVQLPLPEGRYLVTGRAGSNGTMIAHPGTVSLGLTDKTVDPPVPFILVSSETSNEFAVFHVVRTQSNGLAVRSATPQAVLENLVAAAETSDSTGRDELFSLLLRTGQTAFPEWERASFGPAERLAKWARSAGSVDAAKALVLSYHMGNWSARREMTAALVRASKDDAEYWTRRDASYFLSIARISAPPFGTQKQVESEQNQLDVLGAFSRTTSEPVRMFLVRLADNSFQTRMKPALREALQAANADAPSTVRLLDLVRSWIGDARSDQETSGVTGPELLDYWKLRLGTR